MAGRSATAYITHMHHTQAHARAICHICKPSSHILQTRTTALNIPATAAACSHSPKTFPTCIHAITTPVIASSMRRSQMTSLYTRLPLEAPEHACMHAHKALHAHTYSHECLTSKSHILPCMQILRSGERHQAGGGPGGCEGGGGGQKPAEEEELFSFFSSSAYSGYGDGPKVGRLLHTACTVSCTLHPAHMVSQCMECNRQCLVSDNDAEQSLHALC